MAEIIIPSNWEKIDENTYATNGWHIDVRCNKDTGMPFEIKNPQIKQPKFNTVYFNYEWDHILNWLNVNKKGENQ